MRRCVELGRCESGPDRAWTKKAQNSDGELLGISLPCRRSEGERNFARRSGILSLHLVSRSPQQYAHNDESAEGLAGTSMGQTMRQGGIGCR
jgi:hypothetical protein